MSKLSNVGRMNCIVVSALVGFTATLAFAAIALYGVSHLREWEEFTSLPIMSCVKLAEALGMLSAGSHIIGVIAIDTVIYTLLVFAAWESLLQRHKRS